MNGWNKRKAQLLTVHFSQAGNDGAVSRSLALPSYEADKLAACALSILNKHNDAPQSDDSWYPPLKYLGLSVGKFMDYSVNAIEKFFKAATPSTSSINTITSGVSLVAGTKCLENVEVLKEDLIKTSNCNNTKNKEESSSLSNNKTKPNVKVSFFEKYFKNHPNKFLSSPTKLTKPGNEETHEDKDCTNLKESMFQEDVKEKINCENHPFVEDSEEHNEINMVPESNHEASWISPSEIFPDLDDIDDSVLNILPSPLQRKISNLKNTKNKVVSEQGTEVKVNVNSNSRVSMESSDCTPTTVETVVEIHNFTGDQNTAGTSSRCLRQNIAMDEEEDEIESEGIFNRTTLDVFDLEFNEVPEESKGESEVCDKCSYCKEYIPVVKLQEHLDHHMAVELQDQINKQPQSVRTISSNEIRTSEMITVRSDKKKRGRPSKKDVSAPKKLRTIISFFSKS